MDAAARALRIYGDGYAASYPSLYTIPWRQKHDLNIRILGEILTTLRSRSKPPAWLDIACGQAWHFAKFKGRARMVGVDISEHQLARARANVPDAEFILADMRRCSFSSGSFDLVTNLWAGYCYIDDRVEIGRLFRRAIDWVSPNGTLYFELLLGADVGAFNASQFSQKHSFAVQARAEDFARWSYSDSGGTHLMTSPPLSDFLDIASPHFDTVEAFHDSGFMVHFIARRRRDVDSEPSPHVW